MPTQIIKQLLPRSLFGRTLLIVVLPMLLLQLASTYIFLERHWDTLTRRLSVNLASDVYLLLYQYEDGIDTTRQQNILGIKIDREPVQQWDNITQDKAYKQFKLEMAERVPYPVKVKRRKGQLEIYIKAAKEVLLFRTSFKRLYSITVYIYLLWLMGLGLLLATIAVIFLRNQIRPIKRLAKAMLLFSKDVDNNHAQPLEPNGAREIKLAGVAFNKMQHRIRNQVQERQMMLAGISHDLRTPIARMKLELAMLPSDTAKNFEQDLADMERLIQNYINFVQAGRHEAIVKVGRNTLIQNAINGLTDIDHQKVTFKPKDDYSFEGQPQALERCISNVLRNACRYGDVIQVTTQNNIIEIQDNGPGIPVNEYYNVFKPFYSLNAGHQEGAGLGLAICKDIMDRHGGKIQVLDRDDIDGTVIQITL